MDAPLKKEINYLWRVGKTTYYSLIILPPAPISGLDVSFFWCRRRNASIKKKISARSHFISSLSAEILVEKKRRNTTASRKRERKRDYCLAVCDLLLDSIDWFPLSRFFFLNFREPVRNPPINQPLSNF